MRFLFVIANRGAAGSAAGGLLLLLAALLLIGCGDGRAERTSDGRIPISVYLLLISTKQVDYYHWAEQTYEAAHPDVDIRIEQFPGSSLKDYEIKLRLRYSSGQAPDVFSIEGSVVAEFVALGLLDEAPPYIEQIIQEKSRSDMIREAPYYDGVPYGIVGDATPTVLYYNKAMYREAGLDPERPPRTWEEFIDYADRLTVRREDGTIERAGLSLRKRGFKPGTAGKWLTFLFSAGGEAFNDEGTRALFNSPEGREALGFYKTILFDRNIDAIYLEGDQQGFGQGKAAMFIREVHVVRWLRENYPDLDFGVATIPKRDTSFSSGGPYLWVVSRDSPHQEEAWRFIEFLMSDEAHARYCSIGGVIPTTTTVAALPEYSEDPYLQVFLEQPMKTVDPFPRVTRATGILGAYIERFCYGRMRIDETLDRAERDVNALLRRNESRTARNDAD